ncbi:MAG: class I SAM-dependent methyltransferase [Acidobacteriaceae bacterium]|nr:class I SAM-dependent methyltransferase [Acidobacteriaceae bacterium]
MTKPRGHSNLAALLAELVFRLRGGPLRTSRWIADRIRDHRYDREFGISSSAQPQLKYTGLTSPDSVHYQAVSYSDMRELLTLLAIGPSDVFLDYGSGMGRAVCLAATYPLRGVIGVEISPELSSIARRNLDQARDKLLCRDVRIVQSNAADYEPPSEVSIFFFFNPFHGSLLARVLDNVARSLRNSPRNIQIIFYGTVSSYHFRAQAAKHEWLKLSAETVLRTGAVALLYLNADPVKSVP